MKNVKNTLYSFDDTKDYGFNYSSKMTKNNFFRLL